MRKRPSLTDTIDRSMKPAAAASLGAWGSYTSELTEDELRISAAAQYPVIYTGQLEVLHRSICRPISLTATWYVCTESDMTVTSTPTIQQNMNARAHHAKFGKSLSRTSDIIALTKAIRKASYTNVISQLALLAK